MPQVLGLVAQAGKFSQKQGTQTSFPFSVKSMDTSTLIAAAQQWPLLHVQTQWWVETNQQELHPNRVCGMLKSVYVKSVWIYAAF